MAAGNAISTACEFDHLIVGAHTLEQGAAFVEELLGVQPQAGGRHAMMGTHNMVLRLGARAYLEVIAIDPAGETLQRPRWFGLDAERTRKQLRARPRVLTWAVRTQDIEAATKTCPLALGTIHPMTRGAYAWRITIPDDGALMFNGLIPTVIQWDGDAHPADRLEDQGCELVKLESMHPAPASIASSLAALGLDRMITLAQADHAQLAAIIRSPRGIRTITS